MLSKSRSLPLASAVRNIKLILEYDGTDFSGFQSQSSKRTVQQVLEKALSQLFNKKTKIKSASGRTDAGVHAANQVINFWVDSKLTLEQIKHGTNRYLPHDVAVKRVVAAKPDFHARFGAKKKTYLYRIWNGAARSPLQCRFSTHVRSKLNLALMRKAGAYFIGCHDFKSFTTAEVGRTKNTIKQIYDLKVSKRGDMFEIRVTGSGFLQHMVRNIVGTLISIGQEKVKPAEVRGILKAKDRCKAPATAAPTGLALLSVTY